MLFCMSDDFLSEYLTTDSIHLLITNSIIDVCRFVFVFHSLDDTFHLVTIVGVEISEQIPFKSNSQCTPVILYGHLHV